MQQLPQSVQYLHRSAASPEYSERATAVRVQCIDAAYDLQRWSRGHESQAVE